MVGEVFFSLRGSLIGAAIWCVRTDSCLRWTYRVILRECVKQFALQ